MSQLSADKKALADGIVKVVGAELRKVRAEVQSLRLSMEDLAYRGVWDPTANYRRYNSVTYKGSLWLAKLDPTGKPGDDTAWVVALPRGGG